LVVQKRLSVVSPRGLVVALVVIGALVLGSIALIWVAASSANSSLSQPATVKSFPYGPADRNGADEDAVNRGALADSERYAAQVPEPGDSTDVAQTQTQRQTRGPR
jgi:hypothetical protein